MTTTAPSSICLAPACWRSACSRCLSAAAWILGSSVVVMVLVPFRAAGAELALASLSAQRANQPIWVLRG